MKQQKAFILTLIFFSTLHTLSAQRTTASSRARQLSASQAQIVSTANTGNLTIKWSRNQYNTINHTNFRSNPIFHQPIDFDNPDYALINACLFFMVNEERAKIKGLTELKYEQQLEISAWNHAKQMAEYNFYDHYNKYDTSRFSTEERGQLAGISNPYIAENIHSLYVANIPQKYTYFDIADELMQDWLDSPGHKENILDENALQAGCGIYKNNHSWYAVQNFQNYESIKYIGQSIDTLPE